MSTNKIHGDIQSLKSGQLSELKKLYDISLAASELVSLALARRLVLAAKASSKMVGVLVNRKGDVKFVVLGESTRLYLPDLGRARGGQSRLRGLRLIAARVRPFQKDSRGQPKMSTDFLTDIEKLRLDCAVEIDCTKNHNDPDLIIAKLQSDFKEGELPQIKVAEHVYGSVSEIKESFFSFISDLQEDLANFDQKASLKDGSFKDKACLVGVYTEGRKKGHKSMDELTELARSAKVFVADKTFQWRHKLDPKTIIGKGKLEDICLHALSLGIDLIIFDNELSPSQLRNITDLTDLKILDRTMLILDIFAQRAVTKEGKLQVEMAQLNYSLPRLYEKQTGLSRLTGGIGGQGPGETKLEVDRRRVKDKQANVQRKLKDLSKQRELRRNVRKNNKIPIVAIVGYTNAGKSTLLNVLSKSKIYTKDELFATLDPHSRRVRFPGEKEILVTDTVGFINRLPKSLMKAFKSTLEELNDADILLHVVDLSDENHFEQTKIVEKILSELGLLDKKRLLVYNKIDQLTDEEQGNLVNKNNKLYISAQKKVGLKELVSRLINLANTMLVVDDFHPSEGVFFDQR